MSKEETMKIIDKLDEIIKNGGGYLEFFEFSSEIDKFIKKEMIKQSK
ncbi:hypothetical protein R9X47_07055 [Wukongibacter baidiensis]